MFYGYFFHYFYGRAEMPAGKVRWTPPKHTSKWKGQKHMKNNLFPSVSFHTNLPGKEHNKVWPSVAWKQSSGTLGTLSIVGPDTTYIFICRYLPPCLADKQYRVQILRTEENDVGTEHTNKIQWSLLQMDVTPFFFFLVWEKYSGQKPSLEMKNFETKCVQAQDTDK